jgi:hypothetical protein
MGKTKPWQGLWRPFRYTTSSYRQLGAKYFWFDELQEINKKLHMGLDMKHWNRKYSELLKNTSFGHIAQFKDQSAILGLAQMAKADSK